MPTRRTAPRDGTARSTWLTSLALTLVIQTTFVGAQAPAMERASNTVNSSTERYATLPLAFEPNAGQTHRDVKFLSRAPGYVLFLTETETVVAANDTPALRMRFAGANAHPAIAGGRELAGRSNYYRGKDTRRWVTDVPHYAEVRYSNVYSGVDVVYYGTPEGRLEYDVVVAPRANAEAIALVFDGPEKLHMDREGNLHLESASSRTTVILQKPVIYQEIDGARQQVTGAYALRDGNRVGFEIGDYDRDRPLVIDPVITLAYSTFLGGTGHEKGVAIAVDDTGSAVITGNTRSVDFPTANAIQSTAPQGDDHFVAKLNPTGSALVYATYLGGTEAEGFNQGAVALDTSGNAYVAGNTHSPDFPTTAGSFQPNNNNPNQGFTSFDGYVVKLSSTGTLVYSTYLGGSFFDGIYAIDVDAQGNAYVTGTTQSGNFPLQNPIQSAQNDGFVTKLNAAGSALVYSTYLGGNGFDIPVSIAVDGSGNAYVTGLTESSDFPTVSAIDSTLDPTQCPFGRPCGDAFLTKINAAGSAFVYSTYLGGDNIDRGVDLEVDAFGAVYIVGDTLSTNFPTANPLQPMKAGAEDMFITKVNPAGNALVYSTYLGGTGREGSTFNNGHIVGFGIAVDGAGDAYVGGVTASADFPAVDAFQAFTMKAPGEFQAFVAKLNGSGTALTYSTAINPPQFMDDQADVAIDPVGNAYITGGVGGPGAMGGFPTTANAVQPNHAGATDAYVAKLSHFTMVTIDIKPNSSPNTINLGSGGVVPVAILSSATFDATTVNPLTVTLASAPVKLKGNGTPQVIFQDVNGDGRQDIVVQVETEALQLNDTDTQAVLEGETVSGAAIVGTDLVRIVP